MGTVLCSMEGEKWSGIDSNEHFQHVCIHPDASGTVELGWTFAFCTGKRSPYLKILYRYL